MPKLTKELIHPGTWRVYTPEGYRSRTITQDDVRHWAKQFSDMKAVGLLPPVVWEHSDFESAEGHPRSPRQKRADFAKNTLGWPDELTLDGDKLVSVLDIPSEDDARRAEIQFVSPQILPTWTDGKGRTWENVLSHIAITPKPVVAEQGKFERVPEQLPMAASLLAFRTSLADEIQPDAVSTDQPPAAAPASSSSALAEVLGLLAEYGIRLPDDTTEQNLLDKLKGALVALKHAEDKAAEEEEPMADNEKKEIPKEEVREEQPQYAALSQQLSALQTKAAESETKLALAEKKSAAAFSALEIRCRKDLTSRIERLFGRMVIPKTKYDALMERTKAVQFSYGADGQPEKSALEEVIEAYEELPDGAALDSASRQKMEASQLSLVEHRSPIHSEEFDADKVISDIATYQWGTRPRPGK